MPEPTQYVIADNLGNIGTLELFESNAVCMICGGELMYGRAEIRMENTDEMSMVTDIDSGNKIEGELRAKTCPADNYTLVRVEISSYAGY